ncbi:MAG: hypothetical protein A3K19_01655 [Lentisphaerae bacterium RIFOXYB12_FULL_65_16]|nr:MAG: hypothetical protein A3K18_02810 [Lentisphaerae bacterium RIFOXYA12_64_32]OGV92856.1 MAG: hypothetical protein A3K19_01655 [Lentisphaerae bacterium RIFOXYB12_FULL_65_16]
MNRVTPDTALARAASRQRITSQAQARSTAFRRSPFAVATRTPDRVNAGLRTSNIAHSSTAPRPRPFTLIELLVVIAIIAMLASMLLPALRRSKDTAVRVQCTGNAKQIAILCMVYAEDYDAWFPPHNRNPNWIPVNNFGYVHGLGWLKHPPTATIPTTSPSYVDTSDIFFCPSLAGRGTAWYSASSSLAQRWDNGSSGYSYHGNPWLTDAWTNLIFVRPLRTGDSTYNFPTTRFVYGLNRSEVRDMTPNRLVLISDLMSENPTNANVIFRPHPAGNPWPRGAGNVGFADGHVQIVKGADWQPSNGTMVGLGAAYYRPVTGY